MSYLTIKYDRQSWIKPIVKYKRGQKLLHVLRGIDVVCDYRKVEFCQVQKRYKGILFQLFLN